MKIQSFKILNGKAFVAKIVILLLVLVVIGYGLYYSNTKNDFVSESVTIANDSELKTMKVTIQVPDRFEQYLVEMNKYIFEGARNPSNNWKFVSREVTVYSRSEDIVIASAQAAAEQIDTQGGIPSAEVVYFKIVNKTAYILLAMQIDSWVGTSASLAKIKPLVEKTLLQFGGIDSVVFGVAPGDSMEQVSRSYKRKSITVISPYGGEQLIIGNKYEIVWSSSSNSELVRLFLIPGNIPITSLSNAAAGFSSPFDWTIDKKIVPGKYKIEARQYSDYSDVPILIAIDQSGEFTITNAQKIVTEKLPDATKNKYYAANIQTEGFATSTLKWQIINGTLPAGLHIQKNEDVYCLPVYPGNCSTPDSVLFGGMISGKPTQEGTYTFTVIVSTETQSATKSYSINVVNLPNLPDQLISVVSPNGGEQLVSGSIHQIKWNYPNATSTSKVDLYLVDPGSSYYPCVRTASSCTPSFRADLDKNIFANTTYSWIVGTDIVNNSIRPGYYLMQICIAGTNDCDVSNKTFEITSLNSSPRIEPSALPNSPVTSYYSQELEVIGFSTSTVTWQIVGGSLPQGLYLEKQGLTCTSSYPPICPRPETIMFKALIVGMPTKAGNYNFTVKASNGTQSVTKTYSLNLY